MEAWQRLNAYMYRYAYVDVHRYVNVCEAVCTYRYGDTHYAAWFANHKAKPHMCVMYAQKAMLAC